MGAGATERQREVLSCLVVAATRARRQTSHERSGAFMRRTRVVRARGRRDQSAQRHRRVRRSRSLSWRRAAVIARSAALYRALSMMIGCASYQSAYVRQSAAPGELVWRYDDRLQVTRDGQVVAEADRWDGLAAAVACVPRARDWASAATSRHRTGTALLWSGLISMCAGAAVFEEEVVRTDGCVTAPIVAGGWRPSWSAASPR